MDEKTPGACRVCERCFNSLRQYGSVSDPLSARQKIYSKTLCLKWCKDCNKNIHIDNPETRKLANKKLSLEQEAKQTSDPKKLKYIKKGIKFIGKQDEKIVAGPKIYVSELEKEIKELRNEEYTKKGLDLCRACAGCKTFVYGKTLQDLKKNIENTDLCIGWCKECSGAGRHVLRLQQELKKLKDREHFLDNDLRNGNNDRHKIMNEYDKIHPEDKILADEKPVIHTTRKVPAPRDNFKPSGARYVVGKKRKVATSAPTKRSWFNIFSRK